MIHLLARWLLPLAALACWRWSRLVATALALGLVAELAYDVAPWEPLRWVSVVTGTMGIVDLWRRNSVIAEAGRDTTVISGWRVRLLPWGRPDVLAILLVWSSLADGLALLWWRRTEQWGALPVLQVITLLAMITVAVWPRRKHA